MKTNKISLHHILYFLVLFFLLGCGQKTPADGVKRTAAECETICDYHDDLAAFCFKGKWGYIDRDSFEVIPPIYGAEHWSGVANPFSEGLAAVCNNDMYLWGYIDKKGNIVLPLEYDYADNFSNDRGAVRMGDRWGFVDKSGKFVIEMQYFRVSSFSDGLACVNLDAGKDEWFFIDKSGNRAFPEIYEYATPFKNGRAMIILNQKNNVIDKTGKLLYDEVNELFDDTRHWAVQYEVVKNNLRGFINSEGQEVVAPVYDDIYIGVNDFMGFFNVRQKGKWGIIDTLAMQIAPAIYDEVGMFCYDLCAVSQNGKWGFINLQNKMVIPLQYDGFADNDAGYPYVYCFNSDGLAAVKKNGKWGFIDRENRTVLPFIYDNVLYTATDVFAFVEIDGTTMYIDKKGNEIDINTLFGE